MKKLLLLLLPFGSFTTAFSQNVGIGVANPQQKLHVGGNVRVDGFVAPGNGIITVNPNGDLVRTAFTGNSNDVLKGDGSFGGSLSSALPPGSIVGSNSSDDSNLFNAGYSFYGEMPENVYTFISRPAGTSNQFDELPMYDKGAAGQVQPPSPRSNFCSEWSGSEMLVWGGASITNDIKYGFYNNGKKYNPNTDTWSVISAVNAPTKRGSASSVWTGTEMIVWGGFDSISIPGGTFFYLNSGARYNPVTNSWATTSLAAAPAARSSAAAVWTGTQMIIWGGSNAGGNLNTGARYNPSTNTWSATSIVNAPASAGVQTKMFWDPVNLNAIVLGTGNTGGRYNPATNTWSAMAPCPGQYDRPTATWTGSLLAVYNKSTHTMYKYSPATNTWATTVANGSYPESDSYVQDAVWTGFEIIYFAGTTSTLGVTSNRLYRYNIGSNTFEPYNSVQSNLPVSSGNNFLMAGSMILKWGGELPNSGADQFKQTSQGFRYYLNAGIAYPAFYYKSTIGNIIYLYKKN